VDGWREEVRERGLKGWMEQMMDGGWMDGWTDGWTK
jgi:hypothetical protein